LSSVRSYLIAIFALSGAAALSHPGEALAREIKGDPIPLEMQGVWARDGKCASLSRRMVLTSTTLRFAKQRPEKVYFAPNDGPGGRSAIYWSQEYVTANLEYDSEKDEIDLNGMGWGYGATEVYKRCRK